MMDNYYSGSTLLRPLSDKVGIEIDRLNFVVSQLVALCIAFLMRRWLHPKNTTSTVRHIFSCLLGMSLSYFCFGNEIGHLLALSTVSYVIMKFQSTKTMQNTILVFSIGYLACIHIKRLIYNYGAYNLDITGPLMVMVQRVSGLAFSLHDGTACEFDKLTAYRRKYITKKKPSLVEYYGYLFQFQSILAGPNILFKDYIHFIDGSNFKTADKRQVNEPSPVIVVVRKLVVSILCIVTYLVLSPRFRFEKAKGSEFIYEWSPISQMGYLLACTTLTRFMYYHAWILAEAVCNASGLGFSGYDEKGNAKWELAKNVDIFGFEFSDNLRNAVSCWNTGTNIWLRFLVYERLEKYEKHKTLFTFLLSAVWHGFYPGYYICFISAALFVSAGRTVRKLVRPYFLNNVSMKMLYDCLTFGITRLIIAYFAFPFVIYDFWPAILIFKSMYFYLHILGLLSLFVLPVAIKYLPKPPTAVN